MAIRKQWLVNLLLALGAVALYLGTLIIVLEHSLFNARSFGLKVAESLNDPRVASFAASQIAAALQSANPDLITARPLIVATAEGLVTSRPFRTVVEAGAEKAHEAIFSEGTRSVVLALPDVEVLLRGALAQASPSLAAKIPRNAQAALASFGKSRKLSLLIDLWRIGIQLAWIAGILLVAGPLLLAAAIWFAPSRRRALFRAGVGFCVAGFLVAAIVPLGNIAAALTISNEPLRGLAQGLWSAFSGDAKAWGMFLAGFGVLLCAGATSMLEAVDPLESAQRVFAFFVRPPAQPSWRLLWGAALLVAGVLGVLFPQAVVGALIIVLGGSCAYVGVRELFRLLLMRVDHLPAVESFSEEARWALRAGLVTVLLACCAGCWYWFRKPAVQVAANAAIAACNGMPELCGRRLDQVVFPAAHNAMSNQSIPGWMFPHHEKDMAGQLGDGVRALLFDVHYGMPGAARIKTDLSAGVNREKMMKILGAEGFDAAMRIRSRLVGVEEGKRGVYLCHGFCELGAYELRPALASIRDFLVLNPEEVLVIIVEDYITPQDLAAQFESSGLAAFVYRGNPQPAWPTLRELIQSGQRVVVFTESGKPGVPWLRPAFENVQETPYSFHTKEEFTCAANRGGTAGSLFLMNHWIETTPTPKPSNAQVVNAHDFLLGRARKCGQERRHLPNIVAVDFYGTGDLVKVARELNAQPGNF